MYQRQTNVDYMIVLDQEDYQHRSSNYLGNKQIQADEIIFDATGDNQQAELISKDMEQHKIPFDQVKRAVSSNLPCFYISFHPTK